MIARLSSKAAFVRLSLLCAASSLCYHMTCSFVCFLRSSMNSSAKRDLVPFLIEEGQGGL